MGASILKKASTICSSKVSRLNNSIMKHINTSTHRLVRSRFLKSRGKELQGKHEDYLLGMVEEERMRNK